MKGILLYLAGNSPAMPFACRNLEDRGFEFAPIAAPDVTHLLLPVPSFEADGRIRGGGIPEHILADLPESVTIIGGNLRHPALHGYATMDLLQDPLYTARNAAITADCAIGIARQMLTTVWQRCPVLVVGWGRIGKCLAQQLRNLSADVTVAARKQQDLALLQALGYSAVSMENIERTLPRYRVIFNTVPASVLSAQQCQECDRDCIKIELASQTGIAGNNVISALGLPGKYAPESSGNLIANTVIRLLQGKEYAL